MSTQPLTIEVAREFHRRMAAIVDAVQSGVWRTEGPILLGYSTDYAFGAEHGTQTLVLKTRSRSAYVRLGWDVVLGDSPADLKTVGDAVSGAIRELR